jgi:hypothetical protein
MCEVEILQQRRDAGAKRAPADAFERADVFEELDRREMRVDTEVLRESRACGAARPAISPRRSR